MTSPRTAASALLTAALLAALALPVAAHAETEVVRASRVALSPPLRSLPPLTIAAPVPEGAVREKRAPGAIARDVAWDSPFTYGFDEALQDSFGPEAVEALPSPIRTFDGINNVFGLIPPDTTGDVGPAHYVQAVNSGIRVWKKDGTAVTAVIGLDTLWDASAPAASARPPTTATRSCSTTGSPTAG